MDAATTITDRAGRTISPNLVRKAVALVDSVSPTNLETVWDVASAENRYRVTIHNGLSICSCDARTSLCSHVLATWLRCYTDGHPVRIDAIDGPKLSAVPDTTDDDSDPFDGLA